MATKTDKYRYTVRLTSELGKKYEKSAREVQRVPVKLLHLLAELFVERMETDGLDLSFPITIISRKEHQALLKAKDELLQLKSSGKGNSVTGNGNTVLNAGDIATTGSQITKT